MKYYELLSREQDDVTIWRREILQFVSALNCRLASAECEEDVD